MFQTNVLEKIKTHILCSINFFSQSRAVYEITWNNVVESDRLQTTIRRVRIACWIPEAIYTHSEYVIIMAFPLQQWLHKRASMLSYTYIAILVTLVLSTATTLRLRKRSCVSVATFATCLMLFCGSWVSCRRSCS